MTSVEFKTGGHNEHDIKWSLDRIGEQPVCIACLLEILGSENELTVKKKQVLGQLVDIFHHNKGGFIKSLSEDICVAAHVALTLLGLCYESENLSMLSVEVLFSILMALHTEEVLGFVVDHISSQVLKLCNYKKCLGVLNLLGRLLHNVSPPLTLYVLQNHGSLVDFICTGLSYPDPPVQCALCYICVELYGKLDTVDVPLQTSEHVAQYVLQTLSNTSVNQGQEVVINMLGLLKTMLSQPKLADLYISQKQHLAAALKKVVVSRVVVVQIGGVQSLITLLRQDNNTEKTYAGRMLEEDLAEFLFEALHTTSDLLIGYLKKHSGSIRLFSGSSLLRQCVLVLNTAVRHHKPHLVLSATDCLFYLLRRDYMTAPTPFDVIAGTIKNLARKFSEQMSMNTHLGAAIEYSREDHPSQAARGVHKGVTTEVVSSQDTGSLLIGGRKEDDGETSHCLQITTVELWLQKLLGVVCKALELGEAMSSDPVADEQSYTCPDSQVSGIKKLSSAESFVLTVLKIVDNTCIPAVLKNNAVLEDRQVFVYLYSVLRKVFQVCQETMDVLAKRLASMGFISLALQAKVKNSDAIVKSEVDSFLAELLNHLVTTDVLDQEVSKLTDMLELGVQQLSGDMSTVLYLLETALREDNPDLNTIYTIVCIVYNSILFYPRAFEEVEVCPVWCRLVCRTCDTNCVTTSVPEPLLRYVVYVYVVSESGWNSTKDHCPQYAADAQRLLLECIRSCETPQDWFTPQPEVLAWCFSSDHITECCATKMLEYYFTRDISVCDGKLSEMICSDTQLTKTLLVLISSTCEQKVSQKTFELLQKLLTKETWKVSSPEIQVYVKSYLPELILRVFLQCDQLPFRDHCLTLSLRLLSSLKCLTLEDPLTSLDIKLLIQVCKWLSSSTGAEGADDLCDMGWMYISTALLHGHQQTDDRVSSIFLKHPSLLDHLLNGLLQNGEVCPRDVLILSLLIDEIKDGALKVTLPLEKFLHLLLNSPSQLKLSGLLFWVVYLTCDSSRVPMVTWQRSESKGLCVSDDVQVVGSLHGNDIRLLYIYLQQCLIQEHTGIQDLAVVCMNRLLSFVTGNTHIYDHLRGQPWNRLLLQVVHEQFNSEPLAYGRVYISILSMMVKHNMLCVPPYLNLLVEKLKCTDQFATTSASEDQVKAIYSALYQLKQDLSQSTLEVEDIRSNLSALMSSMAKGCTVLPTENPSYGREIILNCLTMHLSYLV